MNSVFLVDGNSVFFRSFHGIRELRRTDGTPTNAVYGYIMTLKSLLSDFSPTEMVVAFDRKEETFRSQLYPAYKANREAPPEELITQIPFIKQATELMGIPQFEEAGFEADDLLGAMAHWLAERGRNVVVVSGDKDLMQLVNGSVSMLRLMPTKTPPRMYSSKDVEERYGVPPERLVEVFALMGDSVDNIPGVRGIGEKTAIQLIQEYGTLENLYENLDRFKGKKRENLETGRENAFLSRDLFRIKTDIPLDLQENSFRLREQNIESLRRFYNDLEFRSFAAELGDDATVADTITRRYACVDTLEALQDVVRQVKEKGACVIDTETTSLDVLSAHLVGLAISVEAGQGWYIPLGHREGPNLPMEHARPLLQELLGDPSIRKCAHHFKFDWHILLTAGFTVRGVADDTLAASYLTQPDRQTYKLDALAERLLGMTKTPITDLIGSGKEQTSMDCVDVARASDYACEDVDATFRLLEFMRPQLQELGVERLYREVEIPLIETLIAMERRGIRVDLATLAEQSRELGEEMRGLEEKIYDSVGKRFNLNSPSQLAQILYDDLKALSGRKRSTRADILERLAKEGVAIAQDILDYRQRQKIKSTYLDALQKLIRPETGRVHTTYHQTVVNTGRLSSSDPNLQNIPIRTELGRRVRRAFVADSGWQLISLDYSQIELRVLAHMTKDPGLQSAFTAGEDIHRRTAAEVFDVGIDEVTPDMRRKAKEINFGLNYGMSPYGLARRLGIADEEASSYIQRYFSRYPLVQQYMDETVAQAREHLHVVTPMGRRIPVPGIRDANRLRQENAKRAAINAPIQGAAADMLKKAMVDVYRELANRNDEAAILLTVHDELILEVRDDCVEEIASLCRERMENAAPLSVPTPVEFSMGRNWAELK